jgi:hypothetical protein
MTKDGSPLGYRHVNKREVDAFPVDLNRLEVESGAVKPDEAVERSDGRLGEAMSRAADEVQA